MPIPRAQRIVKNYLQVDIPEGVLWQLRPALDEAITLLGKFSHSQDLTDNQAASMKLYQEILVDLAQAIKSKDAE